MIELSLFKLIIVILHVYCSMKICRGLMLLWFMLFERNTREKIVYINYFNLKNELRNANFSIQCIIFITWIICLFLRDFYELRTLFIAIFISVALHHFTTKVDKNHALKINNLHVGYGAALAYYKNYLEITLTEKFSERIDKFRSVNKITVPKKLFILVPQTCKVHNYLDVNEHENIERCRELPEEEINHAGIKNRKYNVTIYDINGLRMAVEFAQPLKAFYLFKEKGLFTKNEMRLQRSLFSETLKKFQKEDPFKYFEVVEYNDAIDKVEEVLTKTYHSLSKSYNLETV